MLQARIRQRLDELRRLPEDDEGQDAATERVIEAAAALIDYEERLPVLLDRPAQRLSLQIVRWAGIVTATFGGCLAVAAVLGWTRQWWLVVALLPVLSSVALLRMPVPPPNGDHVALRPGAVVAAGGAAVIVLGAMVPAPGWGIAVGGTLLLAGLWHLRRQQTGRPE